MQKHEMIDMVQVTVGGKKVFLPSSLKVGDLKKAGNISPKRSLIAQNKDHKIILKDSDSLKLESGDIFQDIPVFEVGSEEKRIETELFLLKQVYRNVMYDKGDYLWVCIRDFELPAGFNKKKSEMLIELPQNYPFSPPRNFFLDRNVLTLNGRDLEHYYPDRKYNKYYDRGWAWFCVHIQSWKVREDIMQSDNLLTCIDVAYLTLENLLN